MVRTSNVRRILERSNANNCANLIAMNNQGSNGGPGGGGEGGLINRNNVNYIELLCPKIEIPRSQTAGNDPNQTTIQRISQQLQHPLGGTTVFGNNGNPIPVNYLGRREGQSGGSGAPIRNTF
jgi:hypothetical protein